MTTAPAQRSQAATFVGFAAILMWSLLTLLTAASGRMPPFQLAAVTFSVGGAAGLVGILARGNFSAALRQEPEVWALGVSGLFGYHALYFMALRTAPPAEAQLLNYFWPLLIVLFSALLPDERLRWHHILGTALGVLGTIVLFTSRNELVLAAEFIPGYAAAFVAAFVWATYSVLSRRIAGVPTDAVAGFCVVTAALSLVCHLLFETTIWPESAGQWLAVIALGIGPVGAAFYAWDIGVKRGDIRVLGAASYAAPILSTLFLVLAGYAAASVALAVAACLIAGGGLLAAKDMILRKA